MAKKTYKHYLSKVGGTAAVTMAMTVALSAQAHAVELDETYDPSSDLLSNNETLSVFAAKGDLVEAVGTNRVIAQDNAETVVENETVVESNQQVVDHNNAAASAEYTDTQFSFSVIHFIILHILFVLDLL